mmetsp:Transcript_37305/g.98327  ORF Transcript_37305/g.98327 Transcript_37305/m.98327 type:complete len:233 (+) Transcript_37305:414-1112(+)
MSRQLPATRITKMSPKPWSKMISVGTRESEQPRIATEGNCLEIKARRSKALFSGLVAQFIQKRAFPRCSSARTSCGDLAMAWACLSLACSRASSMENPCQPTIVGSSSIPMSSTFTFEPRLPADEEASAAVVPRPSLENALEALLGGSQGTPPSECSKASRTPSQRGPRMQDAPIATPDAAAAPIANPEANAMAAHLRGLPSPRTGKRCDATHRRAARPQPQRWGWTWMYRL